MKHLFVHPVLINASGNLFGESKWFSFLMLTGGGQDKSFMKINFLYSLKNTTSISWADE